MAAPRIAITDLPAVSSATDSDLLVVQSGPSTKKMTVGQLNTQSNAAVTAHIADTVAAHAATAISATPNTAPLSGTDVQTQLGQIAAALTPALSALAAATAAIVELRARVDALEAP